MLLNISTKRISFVARSLCINNFNKDFARFITPSCSSHLQQTRLKYTQNKGVKGLRNRKYQYEAREKLENAETGGKEDFDQMVNLEDR